MKITFIITDITKCAGTERVVTTQADYLAKRGHEIEVISLSSSSGGSFFEMDSSVKIYHLGINSYEYGDVINKLKGYFVSFFRLRKFLKLYKTDLIIGTSRNTNVYAALNCRNCRVIGFEHFAYNNPSPIIRIIRDYVYKKIEKLVVLTNRDFELYSKKGIDVICIPNAVPFSVQDGMSRKSCIALAVGRNSSEKNFDLLLKLWKKIDVNNWILKIVGEGPLLEHNKTLALELGIENVEFIPFTANIIDYYKEASIYMMTSQFEAFPMVLLEAKTCGCVCVSLDCETGPREIIQDGKDGFLIPMNNYNLFISRVRLLISDEQLRYRMGLEAIENSKLYSKEIILKKLEDLLENEKSRD